MTENVKPTILVTDDDPKLRNILRDILELKNFHVLCAGDGVETFKLLKKNNVDVILLDLILPRKNGLEILKEIMVEKPRLPVIMISGQATVKMAVEATKMGAFDFLEKPLDANRVFITLKNALDKSALAHQLDALQKSGSNRYQMLGKSEVMKTVFEMIDSVAPTNGRVLITGESGTGKELVAHALHHFSSRSTKPLIKINCAAVQEELMESELFGHTRGSFTGAMENKEGVFQRAHNATLFLDEIGDMSYRMQAKVLRALEEGEIQRVGSEKIEKVDTRLITATNKDLLQKIQQGAFRKDLYYRLNVIKIHLPPLRERREDIPVLVDHFLLLFCTEYNLITKELTRDAMEVLMNYDWPGNIREVRNFIERLVIMTQAAIIHENDVKDQLYSFSMDEISIQSKLYKHAKEKFEKKFVLRALQENNWNIVQTAKQIGFDRTTLHRKMKGLGILRNENEWQ
ncbi:MAG TPA: sigma-54-dependent Fis family transcriptional regulator [Bacteroidetes bacterium]|nr:sigma-54-dependent Fis family transcriptional regulator [Bacteroidota bacterium]